MMRWLASRPLASSPLAAARPLAALVTVMALWLWPRPAAPQDSRADVIARAQAEKAGRLASYDPPRAERVVTTLKEYFIDRPGGIHPDFGSVYPGGGFTLGLGFRHFYGDTTWLDVKGLYSIRGYKLLEIGTTSPALAGGRLGAALRAGWRDAPQVNFYGLGLDTSTRDRTTFGLEQAYAGGTLTSAPSRGSSSTARSPKRTTKRRSEPAGLRRSRSASPRSRSRVLVPAPASSTRRPAPASTGGPRRATPAGAAPTGSASTTTRMSTARTAFAASRPTSCSTSRCVR